MTQKKTYLPQTLDDKTILTMSNIFWREQPVGMPDQIELSLYSPEYEKIGSVIFERSKNEKKRTRKNNEAG
jgi:hypothetical protein